MTTELAVPPPVCVVTVYNAGTVALASGNAVRTTAATGSNYPAVVLCGSTAGTVTGAFGVVLSAIPTAGTGPCVVQGCASVVGNATIAAGAYVVLAAGTSGSGVRGRVTTYTAPTAATLSANKVLGWAYKKCTGQNKQCIVFVQRQLAPTK